MNKHGLTPEEYFKYICQDEDAKFYFNKFLIESEERVHEETIESYESDIEVLQEQIGFATDTFLEIEEAIHDSEDLAEFSEKYYKIINNSNFEFN